MLNNLVLVKPVHPYQASAVQLPTAAKILKPWHCRVFDVVAVPSKIVIKRKKKIITVSPEIKPGDRVITDFSITDELDLPNLFLIPYDYIAAVVTR